VLGPKALKIDAGGHAVLDAPCPGDHDAIGLVRAAEHQRGDRVAGAGEAQFLKREEREIGLAADRDPPDIRASDTGGGALARPARPISSRPIKAAEPSLAQRSASRWVTVSAS
jgi:hypothetical protein